MIRVNGKNCFDEKKKCCGCGACLNACPNHCITMIQDEEGFFYPSIDLKACVNCGLCEIVCPLINVKMEQPFPQNGYIVQIKDEKIRMESTSGGAFTAIALYTLSQNGVVFGAAYVDGFHVKHISVNREEELWRFRNSKYVQSRTEEAYCEAEEYLKQGRKVCFSGTPCQIEGLKSFLRRDYENLLTVDVVCHAVPSPLVFEKYVQMQTEMYGSGIANIVFREKHYGYKYSAMALKDGSKKKIYAYGIDTDPMLRAFFSNICDRPSCYDCKFKKRYRVSDFTIWDCYHVYRLNKEMDDDKGTTSVLIHTEKGRNIFRSVEPSLVAFEVDADALTYGMREMFESVDISPLRKEFLADAATMSGSELFQKYFPNTIKQKAERIARIFLVKAHLYSTFKKLLNMIKNKREGNDAT